MPERPAPLTFRLGDTLALWAAVVRGPRADGRYYWRIRAGSARGETVTAQVLGARPGSAWASSAEVEAACQAHLATLRARSRAGVRTVGDLLETWGAAVEADQAIAEGTRKAKLGAADRLLGSERSGIVRDPICEVALLDLGEQQLRALRTRALKRYASGTVHRDFKFLREAWTWGQSKGVCPPHSLPRVPIEVRDTRPKPVPEESEIPSVLLHLRGWYRVAFLLLAETGARLSEIAKIRREQLDLARGVLRLKGKKTKLAGPAAFREVPIDLAGDAARELRAWLRCCEATGPVFPGRAPDRALDQALRHACAAAGVPVFSPGALRRRADERLLDQGELAALPALMDHSLEQAQRNYLRPRGARVRRAAKALKVGG